MTTVDETPNPWATAMADPAMRRLPSPGPHFDAAIKAAAEAWVQVYGSGGLAEYATSENRFLGVAERAWSAAAKEHQLANPAAALPEEGPSRGCFLYRLWGPDGRLVYIGVSRCLRARLSAHRRRWDETVWTTATWDQHADVSSMLVAERKAIADEAPPLNVAGVE